MEVGQERGRGCEEWDIVTCFMVGGGAGGERGGWQRCIWRYGYVRVACQRQVFGACYQYGTLCAIAMIETANTLCDAYERGPTGFSYKVMACTPHNCQTGITFLVSEFSFLFFVLQDMRVCSHVNLNLPV